MQSPTEVTARPGRPNVILNLRALFSSHAGPSFALHLAAQFPFQLLPAYLPKVPQYGQGTRVQCCGAKQSSQIPLQVRTRDHLWGRSNFQSLSCNLLPSATFFFETHILQLKMREIMLKLYHSFYFISRILAAKQNHLSSLVTAMARPPWRTSFFARQPNFSGFLGLFWVERPKNIRKIWILNMILSSPVF